MHPRAVGVIAGHTDAATIRAAGADYVEPSIVGNIVSDIGGTWGRNPEYDQPAAPSFAVLFPGTLALSDPATDLGTIERYLDGVLGAVANVAISGAKVVFGSGAARTIPDGVDVTAARARFAQVLRLACQTAARHDLEIILEPLHQGETNLINTIAQAAQFLDEFGIDAPIVADIFHIMSEGEPLTVVAEHAGRIGHVHLADTGRFAPGTGDWPIAELLQIVTAAGYPGDVTIECRWHDLAAELPKALAFVRNALADL